MATVTNCENKELLDAITLLKSCFYVNSAGQTYLNYVPQVANYSSEDPHAVNCDNAGLLTLDDLIKRCIVIDGCGKIALQLGWCD